MTDANAAQTDIPVMVCANHPDRETSLRCNRCEKPICTKCAVLTPTGYRCKECVRGQQKTFETAEPQDYIIGILLAGALSFLGSLLVSFVGFFTIFLAPGAGAIIAEIVRRAISRRRSKRLFQLIAVAVAVGGVLPFIVSLFGAILAMFLGVQGGGFGFFNLSMLWQGVYAFMVTSTVYYRLSGLQFRV